jgi:lipopolysaccharide transport system ATP-binding protein
MYLRLAFAVAAHLEPEILLVDEVLAVGDTEFQKKCLGKMGDVARGGRTVVFVSHDEAAVRRLCSRTLLLELGTVAFAGPTDEAFAFYRGGRSVPAFSARNRTVRTPIAQIIDAQLMFDGQATPELASGQQPDLTVTVQVHREAPISLELLVRDGNFQPVLFCPLGLAGLGQYRLKPGTYRFMVRLSLPYLAAGRFTLDLMLAEANIRFLDCIEQAIAFTVNATAHPDTGWVFSQARGQGAVLFTAVSAGPPERLLAGSDGLGEEVS